MMDLVEGKKNVLGYVLGHKEPPLADAAPTISSSMTPEQGARSPVSVLKTFIENENIKIEELNLFDVPAIPAELKTIVIVAPQYDLSDREMKLLRDFWEKQGRILLLLDPTAKTPKLFGFLNELGVTVNDDRLMANIKTGIQEVARVRDVIGRFMADSPITKRLAEVRAHFPRRDRVNEPDAGGPDAWQQHQAPTARPGREGLLGRNGLQQSDATRICCSSPRVAITTRHCISARRSRRAGAETIACRRILRGWWS